MPSTEQLRARLEKHSDDELREVVGSPDHTEAAWHVAAELLTERGDPTDVPEPPRSVKKPPRDKRPLWAAVALLAALLGYVLLARSRMHQVLDARVEYAKRFQAVAEMGEGIASSNALASEGLSAACAGKQIPDKSEFVGLYVATANTNARQALVRLVTSAESETEELRGSAASKIPLWYPQQTLMFASGMPFQSDVIDSNKVTGDGPGSEGLLLDVAMSPFAWEAFGRQISGDELPDIFKLSHIVVASAHADAAGEFVMQVSVVEAKSGKAVCKGSAPVAMPTEYTTIGFGSTDAEVARDAERSKIFGLMGAIKASFRDAVIDQLCDGVTQALCSAKSPPVSGVRSDNAAVADPVQPELEEQARQDAASASERKEGNEKEEENENEKEKEKEEEEEEEEEEEDEKEEEQAE